MLHVQLTFFCQSSSFFGFTGMFLMSFRISRPSNNNKLCWFVYHFLFESRIHNFCNLCSCPQLPAFCLPCFHSPHLAVAFCQSIKWELGMLTLKLIPEIYPYIHSVNQSRRSNVLYPPFCWSWRSGVISAHPRWLNMTTLSILNPNSFTWNAEKVRSNMTNFIVWRFMHSPFSAD